MKKVIIMINYLRNGGPSKVVYNLIISLLYKYDFEIITFFNKNNSEIVDNLQNRNVKVIEYNYKKNLSGIIKSYKKAVEYIKLTKPDIIHSNGIFPDYICGKFSKKIKTISTIHNYMFEDYPMTYGKIVGKIYIYSHQMILSKISYPITCSKWISDILISKIPNVKYIRNGTDTNYSCTNKFDYRKKLGIKKDDIVFVYMGDFGRSKNVLKMLELFTKYNKNYYLLLFGRGDNEKECRKFESKYVKFLGFKENVIDYLSPDDIYISASKSEGMSISLIESLNVGMHLFISDIPSHREVFSIDESIYLGEIFNENNFGEKMYSIIKCKGITTSDEIKEFHKKYLSSKSMGDGYAKIYK